MERRFSVSIEGFNSTSSCRRREKKCIWEEQSGRERAEAEREREELGNPSLRCLAAKRTNGADRRSDHSGTTQQGAQQPPATENLRETNVELREENPKTSPENLINTFCGAP